MRKEYVTFTYGTNDANEIKRAESMVRLEEYDNFYVYGKFRDGKLLYKECFLKIDLDHLPSNHTFVYHNNKLKEVSKVAIKLTNENGRQLQGRHFRTNW